MKWVLIAVTVIVVALLLAGGDGSHSVADLRLHLLAAGEPIAQRYGFPLVALSWLVYPLVAVNILLPVLFIGLLLQRGRCARVLAQPRPLPPPWPVIQVVATTPGEQRRRLRATPGYHPGALWFLVILVTLLLASALWARDQWRLQQWAAITLGEPPASWFLRGSIALEWLAVLIAARSQWALATRLVLAPLRRWHPAYRLYLGWRWHEEGDSAGIIGGERLDPEGRPRGSDPARHFARALSMSLER